MLVKALHDAAFFFWNLMTDLNNQSHVHWIIHVQDKRYAWNIYIYIYIFIRPSDRRGIEIDPIPQYAFETSMFFVSAIRTYSRGWPRSSSTHEPSDPPLRMESLFLLGFISFQRKRTRLFLSIFLSYFTWFFLVFGRSLERVYLHTLWTDQSFAITATKSIDRLYDTRPTTL